MSLLNPFKRYLGLSKSIYTLFFAIMVNRFGNFVIPFLAMYLTKKLGFSSEKVGFFVMLVSLAGIPGIFIGGILVDRIGRKKVLVLFQFLSACCFIPCAFYPSSPAVPWLMVFSVFFTEAAQVAHNAMVSDLTSAENRTEAFSLIYLGINIGFSIGPVLAGFLFNNYIRFFFMIDSLTTMVSVVLILLYTKETISCKDNTQTYSQLGQGELPESGSFINILLRRPYFLSFLVIYFLYSMVYIQSSFSMPLYIDTLFKDNGSQIYGLLMTVNAVFVVAASTLISMATKKYRTVINIAFSGILYGIGFGMITFVKSFGMFIISTVIWTAGEILASVNTNVFMAAHSPISHRGRFNSVRLFAKKAGTAFGPFIMGFFISIRGLESVWPLIFIVSILASSVVFIIAFFENRSGYGKALERKIGL